MTRSTSWVGLLAVLAGFLCAAPAFSQGGSGLVVIPATRTVVAALPDPPSNTSKTYIVTDGNAADDCTTGSGSTLVHCAWDGAAWVALGGGGGGSGTVTGITADGGGTTTGATVTLSGDTGITTARSTDTVSIDLDDTAVTPGAYTKVDLTVDQQGRITAAASGTVDTSDLAADAVDATILDETGDYTVNSITATGGVTSGQHATNGGTVTFSEGADDGASTLTFGVSDAGIDADYSCLLEGGVWTGNCPPIVAYFDGTTLTDVEPLYRLREFEGLSPDVSWTRYYVDSYNANADDAGPGTAAEPFATVAQCKRMMENFGTRCVLENRKGLAGRQHYGKLAFRPTASVVGCVPGEEVDDDGTGTQVAIVLDVDPPSNTLVLETTSGTDLDTSDSITGTATNSACALSLAGASADAVMHSTLLDSGTATAGTDTTSIIETGQNFTSTVSAGDFVFNTTRSNYAEVLTVNSDTELTLASAITGQTDGDSFEVRPYAAAKRLDYVGPAAFGARIGTLMESADPRYPNPVIHCNGGHPDDAQTAGGALFAAEGASAQGVAGFQNIDADDCEIDIVSNGAGLADVAKVRVLNIHGPRVRNSSSATNRNLLTTHGLGYVNAVNVGGIGFPYDDTSGNPVAVTGAASPTTSNMLVISREDIGVDYSDYVGGANSVISIVGGHLQMIGTTLSCHNTGTTGCSGSSIGLTLAGQDSYMELAKVAATCGGSSSGGRYYAKVSSGSSTTSRARLYQPSKTEDCDIGILIANSAGNWDIVARDTLFWQGGAVNGGILRWNDTSAAGDSIVMEGSYEDGSSHFWMDGASGADLATVVAAYSGLGSATLYQNNSNALSADPFADPSQRGQCASSECIGNASTEWTIDVSARQRDGDCVYDYLKLPFCAIRGGGAGENRGAR